MTGFSVLLAASLLTRIPPRAAAAARKMLGRQVAVALHIWRELCPSVWQGTTGLTAALGIVAETILLLDDAPLGQRIDAFFTDLTETQHRLREQIARGPGSRRKGGIVI